MQREENSKIGCILMASGQSRRFGSNKLLAEFQGTAIIQKMIEITDGELFAKRMVLTRSEEVKRLCQQQGAEVLLHNRTMRNEAVQLGTEVMKAMDACLFCPCDQPLLSRASLERIIRAYQKRKKGIFRLSYGERQGAPILFGREFFQELAALPEKCGGSYLIRKYPEQVIRVMADWELELYDIDTQQDYQYLLEQACSQTKG